MKKLTILALHLGFGGIEKALTILANTLANDYEIEIVSTYKLYDKPSFPIKKNIKVKYLLSRSPNKKEVKDAFKRKKPLLLFKEGVRALYILIQRKKRMIQYIKSCNSDIILSTRDIHNAWLSKYGKKDVYKIGWEHNHHSNNPKYIKKIVKSAQNLDAFVLVSKELYEFYQEKLKKKKCKTFYIPNCIEKVGKEKATLKSHNLITVGRLSPEKGHQDLIEVMHLLDKKGKDFHLNIIGDGPEKENIEKKVQKYKLEKKVTLLGFQNEKEIKMHLLSSSLFLLPSYKESFGIVVLEAFAEGVPVIAFSSARGACEIIENNESGYIIKNRDKQKMVNKIVELWQNIPKMQKMGENAKEKAKKYEAKTIKQKWVDLFEKR